MSISDLKVTDYLPHRAPFLFVDWVEEITERAITAQKNISEREPFFKGHFPEEPIMPGVLIIECLAQTAAIFAFRTNNKSPKDGYGVYLSGIDKAKFRRPVRPGDTLRLQAELIAQKQTLWRFKCHAYVKETLVCSVILTSAVKMKPKNQTR